MDRQFYKNKLVHKINKGKMYSDQQDLGTSRPIGNTIKRTYLTLAYFIGQPKLSQTFLLKDRPSAEPYVSFQAQASLSSVEQNQMTTEL